MTVRPSVCPGCGASVPPNEDLCPYCQHPLISGAERCPEGAPGSYWSGSGRTADEAVFQRASEPNERAFSLSVPQGWLLEGGIYRADLTRQVIDAQSMEAKLDLTVKRDAVGSVMIRWCPEIKYCDTRFSPAAMWGFFAAGSTVQGMIVSPVVPAQQFIADVVLPWAHPRASKVNILRQESRPLLCRRYKERMASLGIPTNFEYDGASLRVTYVEDGLVFEEEAQAIVENMGALAGGMWSNKDTVLLRAPAGELKAWQPLLRHIQESVQINPRWLAQEIVNQEFLARSFHNAQQASIARDRRMREIQQQIQSIDRQITQHRMETNAEIMNDSYLTMMDLEEYVNPYTREPEVGSNQWQHRWVTEDGTEYYTDDEHADPNIEGLLNRSDWKRTPIRPRKPH